MITILNTSILTEHGVYVYKACSLKDAKDLVQGNFQSAIGHETTAHVISELLNIDCPVNRIQYSQEDGEITLVFKMNGRPPEGKILTVEEIEGIGYSWGILKRVDGAAAWLASLSGGTDATNALLEYEKPASH